MRSVRVVAAAVLVIACATTLFYFAEHQMSATLLEASFRPEVREALESSMNDQKQLRTLDPGNATVYRKRFDEMHRLATRIDVLRLSRAHILRRYEIILAGVFALVLLLAAMVELLLRRRDERRLLSIRGGVEALSRGETRVVLADTHHDLLGRIARMIEETARVVAGQRKRIESLQHLSVWQEAARRHAHEIRTPVTAARLEVERLASLAGDGPEITKTKESALEELDRLARYTTEFSSFAKLPQPVLRPEPIDDVVDEFCRAFAGAWPNLTLRCSHRSDSREALNSRPFSPAPAGEKVPKADEGVPADAAIVRADRDMLRQLFANLCANSSLAVNGRGTVSFAVGRENGRVLVDVTDNGAGIEPSIRARLFQPYTTTRPIGEGMGLGLAICRKIMLDHDGDLDLLESTPAGTTFRLTFPAAGENT